MASPMPQSSCFEEQPPISAIGGSSNALPDNDDFESPAKHHLMLITRPQMPPLPKWIEAPEFSELKRSLVSDFKQKFNDYIEQLKPKDSIVEEENVPDVSDHLALRKHLPSIVTVLRGPTLVREDHPSHMYFHMNFPQMFQDCVTLFRIDGWTPDLTSSSGHGPSPDFELEGKMFDGVFRLAGWLNHPSDGKGKYDIAPHGAENWQPRNRTPKLAKGVKNSSFYNKYWKCCQCDAIHRTRERSEDEICDPCEKNPKRFHHHCERCPDGGNDMWDAIGY